MVTEAEDVGLRFVCKGCVKLIPGCFRGGRRSYCGRDGGINGGHESILDELVLTKPILVSRVGCHKAVGGDCFRRGRRSAVEMTIEVMAMKQHGNLGLPNGEVMTSTQFNGQLGGWVELN